MTTKLKYTIAISVIFVTGLLSGLFLAHINYKNKQEIANQTELAHVLLKLFTPTEVKEVEMLSVITLGISERKPQESKRFLCKLIEFKIEGMEKAYETIIGTTIFKDNPKADPFNQNIVFELNSVKQSSVRAGCRESKVEK